jgi:arylsulfatase A-like enzyme
MNLVFVSLDTLRSDRLGCLGNPRGLTPNLDRIASEGLLFEQAFATDIPTQPSHTAIFTGRFGVHSEIVSHFLASANLAEDVPWLPSILQQRGYRTGAVDHLFAMKDWFVRGYDDYMPPMGRSRSPGSVINDIGFPWIEEHADKDFFLFLHFWDAHIPYVPPLEYQDIYCAESASHVDPDVDEKLRSRPTYPLFKQNLYDFLSEIPNLDFIADLYDAEVAYLDFEIGRLFSHLADTGVLDDTIVVLFGDHGEIMTEHDAWFDHAGLYDAVTHVPLIIWRPGQVPAKRISSMVALVDIMPTVLEMLGEQPIEGSDGKSLLPIARGEIAEHRVEIPLSEATWQAKRGWRTKEWKYIRSYDPGVYPCDPVELYDLTTDHHEQVNIAAQQPDVVAELGKRMDDWLAAQLGDRPDPMKIVLTEGLPAVQRLRGLIAEIESATSAMKSSGSTADQTTTCQ